MQTIAALVVSILAGAILQHSGNTHAQGRADRTRGPTVRVYFPPINLNSAKFERITRLGVDVKCGEVAGVRAIPLDWYVATQRGPESFENFLIANAGHGASYLWSIRAWDGVIVVSTTDAKCFAVSAFIVTEDDSLEPKERQVDGLQLRQ